MGHFLAYFMGEFGTAGYESTTAGNKVLDLMLNGY